MEKIEFLEGNMEMDYTRSPGKTIGRFLSELRDNQEILGIRDSRTSKVYVPPQLYGPESKTKMETYVPVSKEGVIEYFTVVQNEMPFIDWPTPFAYVAVKLDGASSSIWHRMLDTDKIEIGARVKAVFKEEDKREGSILDIDYFEIIK